MMPLVEVADRMAEVTLWSAEDWLRLNRMANVGLTVDRISEAFGLDGVA